ncbi:NAD dependent epimerase/dehydratase family protein-like protein [Myxozyma melibiosi]|uniref:NAD dependent epimerase/dehydratase family protein-like protein n=1 Tax=Myxozyma melibiosi TaxID=54550 RepID=A0ABR1F5Q6_9ASCO
MTTLAIVGATGLVGGFFTSLARTATLPSDITNVVAISRKAVKLDFSASSNKITNTVAPDLVSAIPSDTKILFSGLGTTKATAGSFEKQYAIDYTLNLDLAKAAKTAGATTYVLVSSTGASEDAYFAYSKMKGELERDVKALDFERTIILRPGLILGDRPEDKRPAEALAQGLYKGLRKIPVLGGFTKSSSIPAEDIAKAAFVLINKGEKGVGIYGNTELVELAKEYK